MKQQPEGDASGAGVALVMTADAVRKREKRKRLRNSNELRGGMRSYLAAMTPEERSEHMRKVRANGRRAAKLNLKRVAERVAQRKTTRAPSKAMAE